MLTAATTPITTPAATPATLLEPPLLDWFVGVAVDDASAGLVMTTVLPGPVLVTTVGDCVVCVLLVLVVLVDDEESPPPLNDGTLSS
jgi:hypothetical protein